MTLGVTLGDANGVGPELLLRAFDAGRLTAPFVVYGDRAVLAFANQRLGLHVPVHGVTDPRDLAPDRINLIDAGRLTDGQIRIGQIDRAAGQAALAYLDHAVDHALAGRIDAIVTLPINKEAVRLSTPDFQGHTDFIARRCDVSRYTMMLCSPKLIVTHLSMHVCLREAIDRVERDRVLAVIELTAEASTALRNRARLAVLGLNPHAGEHGQFGDEEQRHIQPAIDAARRRGLDVAGPLPPDTTFMKALRGQYDAVVCMYHDQGHIPMKLAGFDDTVNVTIGLPIVRTSVDHGTAFDIAYRGIASFDNFVKAFHTATDML